jgi:cysteine desulfurase
MIYLDHNATTPVDPIVLEQMLPYLRENFGNPSSTHGMGRIARNAVEHAREQVAALLGADPGEIVFTGCGTEADRLAIIGYALANRILGDHILYSAVEHPAVMAAVSELGKMGFRIGELPVDGLGRVNPDDVRKTLTTRTVLIAVMHSNNETGTLQPIREIVDAAGDIPVFTDAAQSVGRVPVLANGPGMIAIAGHKFHAPKGVGALYIRSGLRLIPLQPGGGQERGLRSGTENVAGIVGFGAACELVSVNLGRYSERLKILRDRLEARLSVLNVLRNGDPEHCLPNTLNVTFPGVGATQLLDLTPEVCASPGAACHAGLGSLSPVLAAMGLGEGRIRSAVRFSVGREQTEEDIDLAADELIAAYAGLTEKRRD